MKVLHIFATLY